MASFPWSETPAALVLLLAMVLASLWAWRLPPERLEQLMLRPYWLQRGRHPFSLVSNAFIHADAAHLIFNAVTFWAFAFGLEREIGTVRFAALYAVGIAVSDAGTWLQHRHEPTYRSLGASGAILAVLFAAIVYHPTSSIYVMFVPVPIPAPLFAVGYLVYSVVAARQAAGRINHTAHLSGALAGLAFVALTDPAALQRAWQTVTRMLGSTGG